MRKRVWCQGGGRGKDAAAASSACREAASAASVSLLSARAIARSLVVSEAARAGAGGGSIRRSVPLDSPWARLSAISRSTASSRCAIASRYLLRLAILASCTLGRLVSSPKSTDCLQNGHGARSAGRFVRHACVMHSRQKLWLQLVHTRSLYGSRQIEHWASDCCRWGRGGASGSGRNSLSSATTA